MYEAFFGLREKPFALTPNTGFMVQLAPYQACLNLLRVALAEGEGFIKVTGEVGTGKTLLCRALLNELDPERYQLAWLPNPTLNPLALRQALAHELHVVDAQELDNHGLLAALHARLIELAGQGKSSVLLIDEAQALPAARIANSATEGATRPDPIVWPMAHLNCKAHRFRSVRPEAPAALRGPRWPGRPRPRPR